MEYVRLKDIGQIITGNTPPTSKPEYYGDYMPFIKATDIPIGVKCTLVTEQSYSKLAAEKYKKSLVPKGSTCVVTIGSIGKKMTYAHTDLFVNQAINAIVPKDSYDNEYIFYNVRCSVLPQLKKLDSGTTSGRENISKTSFSSIRIPVIKDKNVQRRIGVILSTYDSLIENNTKRIRLLEKMAENLYKEWFVRFRFPGHENVKMVNGLPKGWKYVNFGKLSPIVTGKKDANFASPNGKYKFFTCSKADLMADSYSFDCFAIILAGNGDLNVKLYKGQFEAYQRTYVLTPYDISHIYISYYTIQSELDRLLVGAAGAVIKFLTKGMIEKIKIVVPDQSLLRKFNIMLDANFKIRQNLIAQNTLLARQRDLLLPRLMSGKLEV